MKTSTETKNGKPETTATASRADFPKHPLEEALAVPSALERNGGQPLDAIDMATALNRSPGSGRFRVLTAAASMYGVSGGSYKTQFTMAPLGRAIMEPASPDERTQSVVAAALHPKLFRDIFDYYKGKKFPEKQFFVNTIVRQFGVAPDQAARCADIFTANMRFVGLIKDTPGGEWLSTDANLESPAMNGAEGTEPSNDPEAEGMVEQAANANGDDATPRPPASVAETERRPVPNRILVAHGKSKKPLQQLTKTLDNLGIPYRVAEDEPNMGRPISQKVRETMEECGAAILIFSADEEYFDGEGDSVWKPSENVAHELGASAVMYDDRVILFKEDRVQLASNYSGIGYIPFETDKLDAKVNELLRELMGLKILKLSVGGE